MSKMPPKPGDDLMGWITSVGSYEKVKPDLYKVGWGGSWGTCGYCGALGWYCFAAATEWVSG